MTEHTHTYPNASKRLHPQSLPKEQVVFVCFIPPNWNSTFQQDVCMCVSLLLCVCMHFCEFVFVLGVWMCVCIYVCMYIYVCLLYMHICVCLYICIYMFVERGHWEK